LDSTPSVLAGCGVPVQGDAPSSPPVPDTASSTPSRLPSAAPPDVPVVVAIVVVVVVVVVVVAVVVVVVIGFKKAAVLVDKRIASVIGLPPRSKTSSTSSLSAYRHRLELSLRSNSMMEGEKRIYTQSSRRGQKKKKRPQYDSQLQQERRRVP
jgi:hypothetical protein